MGKIEDPLFHDRIILDENTQKELVNEYASLFKHKKDAAENLGIKPTTFYAYCSYQNKSIPYEIYHKILNFLGLKNPHDITGQRITLTEIQRKSIVNEWENNREHMLDEVRKASKLGIERLEEIYGEDWREDIAEIAREGWKRKYGDEWGKRFCLIGQEYARRKYGNDWRKKLIEKATETLKEIYGEKFWEKLIPMAHQALEEKYGLDWGTKLSRLGWDAQEKKYGPKWREITLERARKKLKEKYGPDAHKIIGKFGSDAPRIIELINSGDMCPECYSNNVITDYVYNEGETVCRNCGLVLIDKVIDTSPEWRAFDQEQRAKRSRVGPPTTSTIHDKGLGTVIDWHDRDIYGKRLNPRQKAQNYRLRKLQRRSRISSGRERNLAVALGEINKIVNNLSLPKNTLETASTVYKKASKQHLIRGRSAQGVTAAAIYVACRQSGLARTLDEVAQASNITKKEAGRSYRYLVKELDYYDSVRPREPDHQYITKFSNQLFMNGKTEEIAHKTLAAARDLKLTSGRGPIGTAAAASYIASILSGERKTQREIAETAQITEVTVRNRYKELVERLDFIISL